MGVTSQSSTGIQLCLNPKPILLNIAFLIDGRVTKEFLLLQLMGLKVYCDLLIF